jgi:hypothetical protein
LPSGTSHRRFPPTWVVLTLASVLLLEAELGVTAAVMRPAAHLALSVRANLVNAQHVPVLGSITVSFDRPIDTSRFMILTQPTVPIEADRLTGRIRISPTEEWAPAQRYLLQLVPVTDFDRKLLPAGWSALFETQPRLSVSGFRIGQERLGQEAYVHLQDRLDIDFPEPMRRDTVYIVVGGSSVRELKWSADAASVSLGLPALVPYKPVAVEVPPGARTAAGDSLTEGGRVAIVPIATLPSNFGSGIGPEGKPSTPIEVVFDNAPPARPPNGIQYADLVYEYLSEYQVSRMTAIYMGQLPGLMGPVRSCRMVNPYLNFAFQGVTMCSGASVGTLHYMFGSAEGLPPVPSSINDFDRGSHFNRVGFKPAPHNVFTTAEQADRLRSEVPLAPGPYSVSGLHPDVNVGEPAGPPDVPLHSVSYTYDAGATLYIRFDHGQPYVDATSGGPVSVKNVVMLHVPFRDAGWIEDDNGGAHSIWYDLLGSGPAEIYSNGRVIQATWHMGEFAGEAYFQNHTPVWFSDASGKMIDLNSGLTWIHVLGNGQTG